MKYQDANDFLDWFYRRIKEEPEFEEAFNKIDYIRRIKLERDARNELEGKFK